MTSEIFAVFDVKAAAYAMPFFSTSLVTALRAFGDACLDPNTMLAKHPGDFQLFHLGTFDDASGFIDPIAPAVHVATASQFVHPQGE